MDGTKCRVTKIIILAALVCHIAVEIKSAMSTISMPDQSLTYQTAESLSPLRLRSRMRRSQGERAERGSTDCDVNLRERSPARTIRTERLPEYHWIQTGF